MLAALAAGCAQSDAPDAPEDPAGTFQVSDASGGLTIQLLDKADVAGNVRITAVRQPAGQDAAPPYIVVGQTENPIILRDDGLGADLKAGDRVYSAFAFANSDALAARNRDETSQISQFKIQSVPTFSDRVQTGTAAPSAFDFASFTKGAAVAFNPSIVFAPASPAPGNSLLINNPAVVGDPVRTWDPCSSTGTQMGAFTFGHLMTEMANQPLTGISPSSFTLQWLQTWLSNQSLNTFTVPARPNIATQVINPWLAASGGVSLNLGIAPFRLLAIVNRLDLRAGGGGYGGGSGNAGELRFVFGAVKPGTTCQLLPFTVIFEYGVPLSGCVPVRSWAQQWVALSSLAVGSPGFEAALQAITDQVILRNAAPAKPNGSALNQLRTNEIALAGPWELRQFNLLAPTDFLHEQTAFNTPNLSFNATATFDSYLASGIRPVPLSFPSLPFLAGAAPIPSASFFWQMNLPNPALNSQRFDVSSNTCNACHAFETHTPFTHISPTTPIGTPAALSGFLTGISVADPQFGTPVRAFNDLARRQADLVGVAHSVCLAFPHLDPVFVNKAFDGGPLPVELVTQPVSPVAQQGTFMIEDFGKTVILTD